MKLPSIIILLISFNCYPQYAHNENITDVINANVGRYVAIDSPSLVVYSAPPEATSTKLPPDFAPMYYSWVPQETTTDCTNVLPEPPPATPTDPPESSTPTEPTLPQCDSIQCPPDQTRAETETTVTCSWEILAEDSEKKSVWDQQNAEVIAIKQEYDESQLAMNLNGYCEWVYHSNCASLNPTRQNRLANRLEKILNKTANEILIIMRH